VVTVALLATVAACGDGDDPTTAGGDTTARTAPKGGGGGSKSGGSGTSKQGKRKDSGSSQSGGSKSPDSGSDIDPAPLRVSGGGSAQFRVRGGDNSIQDFGEEGDESELQAAAEAVHGFYAARAEKDWARACTFLAKSMVAQLRQLVAQTSELQGKGCGSVLQAFTRPLPASTRREMTVVDAGSLRRDGDRGFLIYRDAERTVYGIPLEDEDGAWKLTLLSGTPLG
jgi:hypothetical protein